MDKKYSCYCGLYCENCAVKVKVEPAAKVLYGEMKKLGFESIISFFPDGEKFWLFLKNMVSEGICISCKEGSGNPSCQIRLCAREKNIDMCALCRDYPCEYFKELFIGYKTLEQDNAVLREKGWSVWEKIQDERLAKGDGFMFTKESAQD